ncbi:MAG: OmpA family protein [Snowella sp.]|nr:OmpA family protein [Snowella sp.]
MSDLFDYDTDEELLEEQDSGVWLSVGDLMSSLVMIFALLFITVLVQLNEYKRVIEELPQRILNALEGNIKGGGITVDPETGDVSLANKILFDENSAVLKPEGKRFLQEFIPIYSKTIFSNPKFDQQVIRIIIEGHTSSKGSEQDNVNLSLKRSLSVSDYILSQQLDFPEKNQLKKKLMAAGRGEIDSQQKFDDPQDRKVVFRFQFKREDLKLFENSKQNKSNN